MENSSENKQDNTRFTFKKEERLCSKKQIEKLFSEGTSFLIYPLKVIYTNIDFNEPVNAKAAFAVSKKLFKKAVKRNLVKRRIREAYRLNKHILAERKSAQTAIIFIYVGKEILDFAAIEKAMQRSLISVSKKV
jgi:ribonuclease P protein component